VNDQPHVTDQLLAADQLLDAVRRLSEAFATRDATAALACFVQTDDISYVGSEQGERARGREAVASLFASLFARPEAYSWRVTDFIVHDCVTYAYVSVEADGLAITDGGDREAFPYRLSGLLEPSADCWAWRACQASVPEPPQ
jgi:hypothetical protein